MVDGVKGARQLALGNHHSCARLETGRVLCWGENRLGQLGNGVPLVSAPVAVLGLP